MSSSDKWKQTVLLTYGQWELNKTVKGNNAYLHLYHYCNKPTATQYHHLTPSFKCRACGEDAPVELEAFLRLEHI